MSSIRVNNITVIIPDKNSPCDLWRSYFNQLRSLFGISNAKNIWLLTWSKNGQASCTTNPEFNKWLGKEGIDVSNAATKTIADFNAIRNNIFGLGKGITKVISIGVPIVLTIVLIGIIMAIYNSSKKLKVEDVAAAFPQGRAALALKAIK